MKILSTLLSAVLFIAIANADDQVIGNGKLKKENRNVAGFHGVSAGASFDLEITCGKAKSFSIEADENLLPILTSKVVNGVLELKALKSYSTKNRIIVRITVPELNSVTLSGSSSVNLQNLFSKKFQLDVSGSTSVRGKGKSENMRINVSGSANVDLANVASDSVKIDVSGSASVKLAPKKSLSVDASGVAKIAYKKQAGLKITKNTSGLAELKPY